MGADPFARLVDNAADPLRLLVEDGFEPAYLEVWRRGELGARVAAALRELEDCRACPRDCGVDRMAGETRVCNTGRHAVVSSAFPHFGEEDCLRGWNGSGTIFFSHCNLRCVFCQNYDISQAAKVSEVRGTPPERLAFVLYQCFQGTCYRRCNGDLSCGQGLICQDGLCNAAQCETLADCPDEHNPATPRGLAHNILGFQDNVDADPNNWSVMMPRESGGTFRIKTTWEMTDVGHQLFSTWTFGVLPEVLEYCQAYGGSLVEGWGRRDYRWQSGLGIQHELLPRFSADKDEAADLRHRAEELGGSPSGVLRTLDSLATAWREYKKTGKWHACLIWQGKKYSGRYHDTPEEAALAYDALLREKAGGYGTYNFPRPGERGVRCLT